MKKYNVVTLCGSTRFKDDFIRIQKECICQVKNPANGKIKPQHSK